MGSDQEFLASALDTFEKFNEIVLNWCVIVRGVDLVPIFSSHLYNKVFNVDLMPKEDIYKFINTNPKHLQEQHLVDLETVIKNRKSVRSFVITEYDNVLQPFLLLKSPLINPKTNEIVGVFCQYTTFSFVSIQLQIIRSLEIYDYQYDVDIEKFKLTTREKEAIFLFLSGLSSKDIALVISKMVGREISKSTIDSLFRDQLFVKFEVYNREALFEKLLRLGFDRYVPVDLLPRVELSIHALHAY